jgi:hypothetical protein
MFPSLAPVVATSLGAIKLPVAFVLFHGRYAQELVNCLFWVVDLDLLGIVVFVLDPDVTGLILVCILIFEVVTVISTVSSVWKEKWRDQYSSSPESCIKSSSSDILGA